jgi:hypothetical protein
LARESQEYKPAARPVEAACLLTEGVVGVSCRRNFAGILFA